jgi:hypothetical protein
MHLGDHQKLYIVYNRQLRCVKKKIKKAGLKMPRLLLPTLIGSI